MTSPIQVAGAQCMTSTVIALHCSFGSGRQWAHLAETLGQSRRILAPDIAGYGNDPGPFEMPTTLAEEVEALTYGIAEATGPIHLVGHSYGGAIAFKIATDSPLDDRFHETGLDEASMELELCLWIPRLRRAERGAVTWQHGGKPLRWG